MSVASTATTASDVFIIADFARSSNVKEVNDWGTRHAQEYESLQDDLGREAEVRELLCALKPELASEFTQAAGEVSKCLAGTSTQASAGIAMRNVLEHYKGELFDRA